MAKCQFHGFTLVYLYKLVNRTNKRGKIVKRYIPITKEKACHMCIANNIRSQAEIAKCYECARHKTECSKHV